MIKTKTNHGLVVYRVDVLGCGLEKPHEQKGSVGLGSVCVFFLFQRQLNEVLLMILILRTLV